MKKPGKRKHRQHKNDKATEDEEKEEDKDESKGDNIIIQQYPKFPGELYNKKYKKIRNKLNKQNEMNEISKQSYYYNYVCRVLNNKGQTNKKYKEDEEDKKEEKEKEDNKNKEDKEDNNDKENNEENIDKIFLSSLYDLFEEYDEIIIQKDKEKQYKINACIKIDDDKEIKFEIIYDQERDYFDYYPNNKNFEYKEEDEPFNHDLDIPKTDFCLLIRNFKKFKNK